MLEAMAVRGKKFEYLIDEIMLEFGDHEYFRVDLHPDAEKMPEIIGRLKGLDVSTFAGLPVKEISKKDGTKLIFEGRSSSAAPETVWYRAGSAGLFRSLNCTCSRRID